MCLTYTRRNTRTHSRVLRGIGAMFMPLLDEEMLEALGSLESMLTTSLSLFLPFSLPQSLSLTRSLPSPVLSL